VFALARQLPTKQEIAQVHNIILAEGVNCIPALEIGRLASMFYSVVR
jgi:hypothetical protein